MGIRRGVGRRGWPRATLGVPRPTRLRVSAMRFFFLAVCAWAAPAADFTAYISPITYSSTAIATDGAGNTYLAGGIWVPVGPSASQIGGAFVTKFDPSGNATQLATLTGNNAIQANGIAVDPSGNIYIAGQTLGDVGSTGGVLVKLKADGTLLYSMPLGGTTGPSSVNAVAVDLQGYAYITGETSASDYPHTAGMPADPAEFRPGGSWFSTAFFAKIAPGGDRIVYAGGVSTPYSACGSTSTCLLSEVRTLGTAIAVDPSGNAYIAGNTSGRAAFGSPGALLAQGIGAFVIKVNAVGTGLAYVTFLDAKSQVLFSEAYVSAAVISIEADAAGNVYLAGATWDPSFPVTPSAFQAKMPGASQVPLQPPTTSGFVAKLNPAGSAMVWASFLGGQGDAVVHAIALDAAGDVWVSGTTASSDFPFTTGPPGSEFLAEFNPTGSSLLTALSFPADTTLAIDQRGTIHCADSIAGLVSTLTPGGPPATRVFGLSSAAVAYPSAVVAPAEVVSIYGVNFTPSPVTASLRPGGLLPTTLSGVQVTMNGIPAPLLYVSPTQINAIAPIGLQNANLAAAQVTAGGVALPVFSLPVYAALPAVFTGVLNQDGSLNSASNPAAAGSYLSIWATGIGASAIGTDGAIATTAFDFQCCTIHDVAANQDIAPSYAGAAPGLPFGIVQVNFQATVGNGTVAAYTLRCNAGGGASQPFQIYVKPN